MISKEEMVKILCQSYSGLRTRIVLDVDFWMANDGDISYFLMISSLSSLVVENILDGNYDDADALFLVVDVLLKEGDENVQNVMATGFLESMQNQTKLEGKYWSPLLGKHAAEFCRIFCKQQKRKNNTSTQRLGLALNPLNLHIS